MKKRLVVSSHKGGVGKSTIALNLATTIADRGFKTVLLDLDPQGGILFLLAGGDFEFPGITEVLVNKKQLSQVLIKSKIPNLSLFGKGKLHAENIPKFASTIYRDNKLASILATLEKEHDYIIIDTPTGMGRITRMALRVSSHVMIPVVADINTLRSLNQILHLIDYVQTCENPKLQILGLLLNMVNTQDSAYLKIANELYRSCPLFLANYLPQSQLFSEASSEGVPLSRLDTPAAAQFFKSLADEILQILTEQTTSKNTFNLRVNSDDMQQTQILAERIAGRRASKTSPSGEESYISIPTKETSKPQTPAAPTIPQIGFNDKNIYREDVWKALLEWAVATTVMEKAFIVDAQGFIIAIYGEDDSLQELEANFLRVISQIDRCGKDKILAKAIQIKLLEKWLTAFYLDLPKAKEPGEVITICLIGKHNLAEHVQQKILQVFQEKIREL